MFQLCPWWLREWASFHSTGFTGGRRETHFTEWQSSSGGDREATLNQVFWVKMSDLFQRSKMKLCKKISEDELKQGKRVRVEQGRSLMYREKTHVDQRRAGKLQPERPRTNQDSNPQPSGGVETLLYAISLYYPDSFKAFVVKLTIINLAKRHTGKLRVVTIFSSWSQSCSWVPTPNKRSTKS